MKRTAALLFALLALSAASTAPAQVLSPNDAACGWKPPGAKGAGVESWAPPQVGTESYVEARIVFVSFPNHAQTLPTWADEMASQIADYYATMSRGAQTLHVTVLKRTDVATDAWVADHDAAYYAGLNGGPTDPYGYGYGTLNNEIATKIVAQQPGAFSGVTRLFMIHYQCTFNCSYGCNSNCQTPGNETLCEGNCPFGGLSGLGFFGGPSGYTGAGTTSRFYYPDVNGFFNEQVQLDFLAHEYGHTLGLPHSPSTEPGQPFCNMGRYDIMRSGVNASNVRGDGLVPLGAPMLAHLGWLPVTTIATDTRGVHIPDCRAANAAAIRVDIPGVTPPQSFLLENHRNNTPYDAKLAGTGLVIWHRVNSAGDYLNDMFWDLESAVGRFTNGQPDAVAGKDSLELISTYSGSGNDLWDGINKTNFSVTTNPNTNAYASNVSSNTTPQNVTTPVAIENIRRDPNSTDMIVDVYVTPKQYVTAPNGGETYPVGSPVTIQWQTRPYASIANVDVLVSSNAGGSWTTLASAIANTGSYSWTPAATGSQYRVRVVSHDTNGNAGSDDSDANFTVTVAGHWVALPSFGSARRQPALAFDSARHRALLFGGTNGTVNFNDLYAFNGDDTWSAVSTTGGPPSSRRRAGMIYDPQRDRLVVFGGYSNPSSLFSQLSDLWQLNLSTNAWSSLSAGSAPTPILYETQAVLDPTRDRLLVVEGTGIVWAYPLAGGTWSVLSNGGLTNSGYYHFSAAYDSLTDQVLVFGGWIDGPNPNLNNMNGVAAFPLSGPNANTWQNGVAVGGPPAARALSSLVYDPVRDRAVMFGGEQFQTQANTHYGDVWQLGLANTPTWWQLSPTGTGPGLRSQHAAIYDRVFDRMLVTAGTDGTNLFSDAWALSWDQVAPAQVTDLQAIVGCDHIQFIWTAPGDDGATGQGIQYDLRRSGSVITEGTWGSATPVASGASFAAGTTQTDVDLYMGLCSAKYYYAVKVRDDGYNWSPLSNVTSRIGTPCPHQPAICDEFASGINTAPKTMELSIQGANPATAPVQVAFGIPARFTGQPYQVAVFDLAGRRVTTLDRGTARAGRGTLAWDFRSESGRRVSAGVYYVRFRLGEEALTRPVVALR